MGKILIVDDTPFWRDVTAEALRLKGYTVTSAVDGLEALKSLHVYGADLIILDIEMPQLEGLSFLEQIRRRKEWKDIPVIMLTGDMQREHVIQAKKLGAVDYLLKARFSLPDLLSRVEHTLKPNGSAAKVAGEVATEKNTAGSAAGEIRGLLAREESIERASKAMSKANLSPAIAEVISLANSPGAELSDLASLIGRDPVLAARVLQASNRAATAKGRGVITTIGDAVRVVGCTAIRDIAASVGIFDAMPAPSKDGFDPIRSWQHSLAVATISSRIAPAELAGTAYLIGLCHDLGEILFRTHFGWEYNHVLQARAASGNPLHELERQMLGVSHGELVRTILQCLELPEVIAHPIVSFHESAAHGGTPPDRLGRILQIADLYATGMLLSSSEESTVRPLSRSECRAATDVDAPGRLDGAQLRGEIYAMTALYARTASQGQGNLTKPFFGRRAVSLFVAREGSLSSFDPTCAALESLGEVTVRESLPTAWEMVGYNGLVVITRTDTVRGFGTGDIMAAASRGDGPFVPTLWLAGSAGMHIPASAGEVVPRSWVTSLKELADFVEVCQGREVTHT